jgi:hypothetical protein
MVRAADARERSRLGHQRPVWGEVPDLISGQHRLCPITHCSLPKRRASRRPLALSRRSLSFGAPNTHCQRPASRQNGFRVRPADPRKQGPCFQPSGTPVSLHAKRTWLRGGNARSSLSRDYGWLDYVRRSSAPASVPRDEPTVLLPVTEHQNP